MAPTRVVPPEEGSGTVLSGVLEPGWQRNPWVCSEEQKLHCTSGIDVLDSWFYPSAVPTHQAWLPLLVVDGNESLGDAHVEVLERPIWLRIGSIVVEVGLEGQEKARVG